MRFAHCLWKEIENKGKYVVLNLAFQSAYIFIALAKRAVVVLLKRRQTGDPLRRSRLLHASLAGCRAADSPSPPRSSPSASTQR